MNQIIKLKKGEERRAKEGYLWIFSNEVERIIKEIENGEIVEAVDYEGNFLAKCFYNKNSLITLRILSYDKNFEFDKEIEKRILKAYDFRKLLYKESECFRLVFSESDFLPGLIIDKFDDFFSIQINSAGFERQKEMTIEIIKKLFNPQTIAIKNEEIFRKLEGINGDSDIIIGEESVKVITIDEIKYRIDLEKGQKTGFYFDQRENRKLIRKISEGKKVLDLFCNSGGFGLNAAFAGAIEIDFVDSSEKEISLAKENFELNSFKSKANFVKADAFEFLELAIRSEKKYDAVFVDPPAFAKSKKNLPSAIKGYEKLFRKSLKITNDSGFAAFSSCSHHIDEFTFKDIVKNSARKEKKILREIYFGGAAPDHPKLASMPETSYLKFGLYQVFSL